MAHRRRSVGDAQEFLHPEVTAPRSLDVALAGVGDWSKGLRAEGSLEKKQQERHPHRVYSRENLHHRMIPSCLLGRAQIYRMLESRGLGTRCVVWEVVCFDTERCSAAFYILYVPHSSATAPAG